MEVRKYGKMERWSKKKVEGVFGKEEKDGVSE